MIRESLVCMFFLVVLSLSVFGQDEDLQSTVDYKVNKMKTELKLTYDQANAIKPILKDYMIKHSSLLKDVAGQGIVDHVSVKGSLKALKDSEYQQLSKILSEDQMKKWINKENLRATFNPEGGESSFDDGPTVGMNGANLKF